MEKQTSNKKIKIWVALITVVIFIGLMFFLFSGDNSQILKKVFKNGATKDEIREALSGFGWRGYITLGLLSMLQVVLTFLPAEPVQVISGLSFGLLNGGLICLAGVFVGNTLIYVLYKIYGDKLTAFFENKAEFDFEQAKKSNKIALIIFILYFLPAIPYGLICLFTASLNIKYPRYIILTTLGSIPSVLIGVGLGHVAIASSWIVSLLVFLVLVVLLIFMFRYRNAIFEKINNFIKNRQKKEKLKEPNRIVWWLLLLGAKIFFSKVKVKYNNEVGKIKGPAIVLCNHGSFIDFFYTGTMLKKSKPHFVAARLYFYHKTLGKLLRYLGCIPKSMFSNDIENMKGCMRVLSEDGVLVILPEARLSTVGKFEDIQDATYKYIKKMGVPVYTILSQGSYLSNPKWGDGVRKGAKVEVTLKQLFADGETKDMPLEELKEKVDKAIYYDEFAWLKDKDITYKSKTLAEGLENILYICPHCGARYSIKTKGLTVSCESCGEQWAIDNKYAFINNAPFDNFATWYDWQKEQTALLATSQDYVLQSKVELRHSSIDGKPLTRPAGEGVCTLTHEGLKYVGTQDGENIEKFFPMSQIYRLLFGAGEDFEIYEGKEIWYFVPENKRSCVEWYVASGILKNISIQEENKKLN